MAVAAVLALRASAERELEEKETNAGKKKEAGVLLRTRLGSEAVGGPLRAVLSSSEWRTGAEWVADGTSLPSETLIVYPPVWRSAVLALRDSLAVSSVSNFAENGLGPSPETLRLRAALAAAEKECAALRLAAMAGPILAPPVAADSDGNSLELDVLKKRDVDIASLKRQLAETQHENERLLILLADQEMQIESLK